MELFSFFSFSSSYVQLICIYNEIYCYLSKMEADSIVSSEIEQIDKPKVISGRAYGSMSWDEIQNEA